MLNSCDSILFQTKKLYNFLKICLGHHITIFFISRVAVIFSEFKEKNVCVEGNIYCSYIERGNIDSTKKSILFIHGLFGSAVDFVQIAPYFDKSYHLVAIDMYNHSGTTSLNRNVTMEDMVVLVKMVCFLCSLYSCIL